MFLFDIPTHLRLRKREYCSQQPAALKALQVAFHFASMKIFPKWNFVITSNDVYKASGTRPGMQGYVKPLHVTIRMLATLVIRTFSEFNTQILNSKPESTYSVNFGRPFTFIQEQNGSTQCLYEIITIKYNHPSL